MTNTLQSLEQHLADWRASGGREDVAAAVAALALGARELARAIATAPLFVEIETQGAADDAKVAGGAQRTLLDKQAGSIFRSTLASAPVAVYGDKSSENAETINAGRPLAVAMNAFYGSSQIDTNLTAGSIFTIFPVPVSGTGSNDTALLQPGRDQLAAGFFIFGPQTALVLTLRAGTHIFTLDPRDGVFYVSRANVRVSEWHNEYAINASNHRYWPRAVRDYIDDLMAGKEGPRGKDFNMRWMASMVADAYRILTRGGIYLYPRDSRSGYENGLLKLVYEANPMALVFEEAGGAATDGVNRILDLVPTGLHQRTPLIFGSADKVKRVARYYNDAPSREQSSPLFNVRGLFRV